MKNIVTYLLVPLCIAAFSFSPVYSADPAKTPSLLDKVRRTEKAVDTMNPPQKGDSPLSDKQMAAVEKCSEDYEACSEKCTKVEKEEAYAACDDKCKEKLSLCEKDLPDDWKTIK